MLRYIGALRPMFLTVSAVGCLIGFSLGLTQAAALPWRVYVLALVIAVLGQGCANVINDLADADNGSDAVNTDRIYPFTGGSRFLQDGSLTVRQVRSLAILIGFVVVIAGAILLSTLHAWELAWVGLVGLAIGWAYSAEPLKLMSRGAWGEVAIVMAWALIVIGGSMLTTHEVTLTAVLIAVAYGAMVANILYVNQIPDIAADQSVGKLTLAVQTKAHQRWIPYTVFLLTALLGLLAAVIFGPLSAGALLGLVAFPFAYRAMTILKRCEFDRVSMVRAIKATIFAAHVFGLGVAAGLLI